MQTLSSSLLWGGDLFLGRPIAAGRNDADAMISRLVYDCNHIDTAQLGGIKRDRDDYYYSA